MKLAVSSFNTKRKIPTKTKTKGTDQHLERLRTSSPVLSSEDQASAFETSVPFPQQVKQMMLRLQLSSMFTEEFCQCFQNRHPTTSN